MNDELRIKIDDARTEGWKVSEERQDSAVMVKRRCGSIGAHVLMFLVAGWWTLGFANLAYLAYKYFFGADKRVVRVENDE